MRKKCNYCGITKTANYRGAFPTLSRTRPFYCSEECAIGACHLTEHPLCAQCREPIADLGKAVFKTRGSSYDVFCDDGCAMKYHGIYLMEDKK